MGCVIQFDLLLRNAFTSSCKKYEKTIISFGQIGRAIRSTLVFSMNIKIPNSQSSSLWILGKKRLKNIFKGDPIN
jgi:hypothetical protein